MATSTLGDKTQTASAAGNPPDTMEIVRAAFAPLASLKLTVGLLGLGVVQVLLGTLAQDKMDMWEVIREYFRAWITWVEFQVLLPDAWFPGHSDFGGASFPFPGGLLIGTAMMINLTAAHTMRFKIQAKGPRLTIGLGVIGAAIFVTALVIASGNITTRQDEPWLSWENLWLLTRIGVAASMVASVYWLGSLLMDGNAAGDGQKSKTAQMIIACGLCFVTGISTLLVTFYGTELYEGMGGPAGMRILWQLILGGFAGFALLVGCIMVFKQRAGIVVIHGGIALMMVYELFVGTYAVEEQMMIVEGETTNRVSDTRDVHLAIVDSSDDDEERVTVVPLVSSGIATRHIPSYLHEGVPYDQLSDSQREMIELDENRIDHPELPFEIQIVEYYKNTKHELPRRNPKDDSPFEFEEQSLGKTHKVVWRRPVTGADGSGEINYASVVAKLYHKDTDKKIGTYLLTQILPGKGDAVRVDGKTYNLQLRFKNSAKSFSVHLTDVRRENYIGTTTPKDYSSNIVLTDPDRDVRLEKRVWMNNPLRYSGLTFYQSGHRPAVGGEKEQTTLQVVTNTGWMAPYVGCMIVVVGLLAHFYLTLNRFLTRMTTNKEDVVTAELADGEEDEPPVAGKSLVSWIFPVVIVLIFGYMLYGSFKTPKVAKNEMNLNAFGSKPMVYEGRQKPFDTLARNSLRVISGRETFDGRMSRKTLEENWDEITKKLKAKYPTVKDIDDDKYKADPEALVELIHSKTEKNRYGIEEQVNKLTTEKYTAIRWLLDVMANTDNVEKHRIFRIDELDVQQLFDLEKRKGFRYSYEEVKPRMDEFQSQLANARKTEKQHRNQYQKNLISVSSIFATYEHVRDAHVMPRDDMSNFEKVMMMFGCAKMLDENNPYEVPYAAPTHEEERSWEPITVAASREWLPKEIEQSPHKTKEEWIVAVAAEAMDEKQHKRDLRKHLDREEVESVVEVKKRKEEYRRFLRGNELEFVNKLWSDDDAYMTEDELRADARERIEKLEPQDRARTKDLARASLNQRFQNLLFAGMTRLEETASKDKKMNPVAKALEDVVTAYRNGDVDKFNESLVQYENSIQKIDLPTIQIPLLVTTLEYDGMKFETEYNRLEMFYNANILYVVALVLIPLAWSSWMLGWHRSLNRAAFSLVTIAFVIHFFALVARVLISGRPPVTNLYSSAIFIGFACVLVGIVIEYFYKLGIGSFISASAGFSTLVIAQMLAISDGDTMKVLQAVLDTTFWLSTHVVCITLGYAATFLAGFVGTVYIVLGLTTSTLNDRIGKATLGKILSGMVYGIVCFAIFFSFFGTVLGGLWADDSWGRFWGWDPKENGALMIVLWNALVLHARWGGMVKGRGLAILAVVGNIVTAWSWFGVNQLGIGMHSYGFTAGVLATLKYYVLSQLAIIGVALLPLSLWRSFRENDPNANTE